MRSFKIFIAVAILVLAGFIGGTAIKVARANPSRVQAPASCTTSGTFSTTSVSFMTAGTATTTITCNMGLAGDGTEVFDSAILAIQHHASSTTGSTLGWNIELSNDAYDWYAFDSATSTINGPGEVIRWTQLSTSTQDNIANNNSRRLKSLNIPVEAKYVRVNFFVPIGSLNSAVWAQIIGKAERGF